MEKRKHIKLDKELIEEMAEKVWFEVSNRFGYLNLKAEKEFNGMLHAYKTLMSEEELEYFYSILESKENNI